MLFTKELLAMKKYWDSQPIQKKSIILLPGYQNNNAIISTKEVVTVKIPKQIVTVLNNKTNNSDFLRYVIVFSALNVCLSQYNEKEFITVGSDLLFDTKMDDLTIPIITKIDRNMIFKNLLETTRDLLINSFQNKDYFKTVTNQKFNIFFQYGSSINIVDCHDIIITMNLNEQDYTITIKFNSNEYSENTIILFINHLFAVIEKGLEDLTTKLMELPKYQFSENEKEKDSLVTKVERTLQEHRIVEKVKVFISDNSKVDFLTIKVLAEKDAIRSNQLLKRYLDKEIKGFDKEIEFIWVESEEELVTHSLEARKEIKLRSLTRPYTEKEKMILSVWKEVLGIDSIDIEDNFFEIGGDSILSIQAYFKLKELGFNMSPTDIIAYPTIHDLLVNVGDSNNVIKVDQENITGLVQLSPSQLWFFEKNFKNKNHYNEFWSYSLTKKLSPDFLRQSINRLVLHHDMLRAMYKCSENVWEQYIDDSISKSCYEYYNLSNILMELRPEKLKQLIVLNHQEINLDKGPLIKFIHIQNYALEEDMLIIIAHRLIIDNFSIDIIIEDLQQIYNQVENNQTHDIQKTTSYKYWTESLTAYSNNLDMLVELDYWENIGTGIGCEFQADYINGENYEGTSEILYEVLDKDTTEYLYNTLPKKLKTSFRDILFSSLFHVISSWTGKNELLVESGGHGRDHFTDFIDLSRTVGWFTTNYPVYLQSTEHHNFSRLLEDISRQLREIPKNGYNYGVIKYISNNETIHLKNISPKIGFDFQGKFINSRNSSTYFQEKQIDIGFERDKKNLRLYEFDISTWIEENRFVLRWSYSSARYQKSTITRLMKLFLENLIQIKV